MDILKLKNDTNPLILNTPNRNEILNDGPPKNCNGYILGKGAYGTVFEAIFCGQPVAVKIIKNHDDINKKILLNEANIMGWNHKNIMRLLQIESTPKFGIIIMERFQGECLQKILDVIALSVEQRIYICLDILAALYFCHSNNILHLDVKPQNIFVCFGNSVKTFATAKNRNYICKLCDFGASTLISNTTEQSIKGTVRYMSPEALCACNLTPATDIYSLGISMWQLKHRILPYNWLHCNDTVAYQVVKNNLRPNVYKRRCLEFDCNCLSYEEKISCSCEESLNSIETSSSKCYKLHVEDENINYLSNIFQNENDRNHFKERFYEKLYKNCWHYNENKRPTVLGLHKKLIALLNIKKI